MSTAVEGGLEGVDGPQTETVGSLCLDGENDEEHRNGMAPAEGTEGSPFGTEMQERLAAALRRQGIVVAPERDVVPAAGVTDEELVCGVCLETPADGKLATLWCCKNVLCLNDAQHIGVCPFCREEPLVWELKPPSLVKAYQR